MQSLWILKNKSDIRCKFELIMYGVDHESENDVKQPKTIINSIFGIYLNDDDDLTDVETLETLIENDASLDKNDIDDENLQMNESVMDIFLFNQDLLNASNKLVNVVFTKGIIQDFVTYLLNMSNHKRVLMSPIENTKQYEELIIPDDKTYRGLIYLDQFYGLYRRGSVIFYDTDILYIINPNGKCTAKQRDEYDTTTFLITKRDSSSPGNGMVVKEYEQVNYINIPEEAISPQKPSLAQNEANGSILNIVVTDSDETSTVEADQSFSSNRNEAVTYVQNASNRFLPSMAKARMEENEAILYISVDNIDIESITPNKAFRVIYEESSKQRKYGKYLYRVAYADHVLIAESTERMKSSHRIILKRCSTATADDLVLDDDSQ